MTARGVVLQPLSENAPGRLLQPGRRAITAAFSPDMSQIAIVPHSPASSVELWNGRSGQTELAFPVDFPPHLIAWRPDGTRLALAGDRGRLELRRVGAKHSPAIDATTPAPLLGHRAYVDRLRFSPDGSMLMSYAWDQSCFIWDVVSGRPLLREARADLSTSSPSAIAWWCFEKRPCANPSQPCFGGQAIGRSPGQGRTARRSAFG